MSNIVLTMGLARASRRASKKLPSDEHSIYPVLCIRYLTKTNKMRSKANYRERPSTFEAFRIGSNNNTMEIPSPDNVPALCLLRL